MGWVASKFGKSDNKISIDINYYDELRKSVIRNGGLINSLKEEFKFSEVYSYKISEIHPNKIIYEYKSVHDNGKGTYYHNQLASKFVKEILNQIKKQISMSTTTTGTPVVDRAALLAKTIEAITKTGFDQVKFNNQADFSGEKISFRKVTAKTAQYTIEGQGADTSNVDNIVDEMLQFMCEEIEKGNITEVIDYRNFLTKKVTEEGGHIKLTSKFNYKGRQVEVTDIASNGSINYLFGPDKQNGLIRNIDEVLLESIYDEIKKNHYL